MASTSERNVPTRTRGVALTTARQSLGLLVGTVDDCLAELAERRDRYGLNYVNFGPADLEMLSPLLCEIAAKTP